MKEKVYQSLIELTNGKSSSRLLQTVAQSKFSTRLIRSYSKVYGINIEEVSKTIDKFSSLHDFFVRTLKEEARPIAKGANVFTSPVDGKIEAFGDIVDSMKLYVKNKPYSLIDLLGNEARTMRYRDGKFIVFYLSPADYHRIHSPIDAHVIRQYILGQKSYPVNQWGLKYGKNPISQNFRMISEINFAENTTAAFIKVGATFVNSIQLTNVTNHWKKGEEVGFFSFGSTVVMLFEQESIKFTENVTQGHTIRMGEAFATML